MLTKVILIATLVASSCGSTESDNPKSKDRTYNEVHRDYYLPELNIDSRLEGFVQEFVAEADKRNANHLDVELIRTLKFAKLGDDIAGVCRTWRWAVGEGISHLEIMVDEEFKSLKPEWMVRALLFHEMGHCLLRLEHSEEEPRVIMHPRLQRNNYYEKNWKWLLDDLFKGTKAMFDEIELREIEDDY